MAVPPQTPVTNIAAARRHSEQSGVFMREVDEAMRKDQLETFMVRYGKPLLAFIVVALLAFAGYLYWQQHQKTQAEGGSEQLVLALDDLDAGNIAAAQAKLAPLAAGDAGTATMARFAQAGIALEKGKADEAARLYSAIAQDKATPGPLRDSLILRQNDNLDCFILVFKSHGIKAGIISTTGYIKSS